MFNNYELELFIIGCAMKESKYLDAIIGLTDEHFLDPECKDIFNTMVKLTNKNSSVTMADLVIEKCNVQTIQEADKLSLLTGDFLNKLEKLKFYYKKRVAYKQGHEFLNKLKKEELENESDISKLLSNSFKIDFNTKKGNRTLGGVFNRLVQEYEVSEKLKPMYFGIKSLDMYTQGLFATDCINISGRPGKGKTALAIQIAVNLIKQEFKGLFVSLEMKDTGILRRIIANFETINSNKLKRYGNMNEEEQLKVLQCGEILNQLNLEIANDLETVEDICQDCKLLKKDNKLDFVIIDYLQLVKTRKKLGNREQEVGYISRELRLLSLKLDIPIIILGQLNRSVEGRTDKRPKLSDLRESGAIEQDATHVFLLYQDDALEYKNLLEIIIAKQRDGNVGTCTVKYYKPTNLILDK